MTRPGDFFYLLERPDGRPGWLRTIAQVEALVKRISMPMLSMEFSVHDAPKHESFRVRISIRTKDRGDFNSVHHIGVMRDTHELELPIHARTLLEATRACARELWLHEFDEWFSFCGQRTHDPHLPLSSRDTLEARLHREGFCVDDEDDVPDLPVFKLGHIESVLGLLDEDD